MRKILIVTLTLCCFFSAFAQKSDNQLSEKFEMIQAINQAMQDSNQIQYEMLDSFITKYGLTSDALILQAIQAENQENYEEARAKLDQAIAIVTNNDAINKTTLYNLRMNYCESPEERLVIVNMAIKADPKNLYSYLKRAQIYKYFDDYKKAVKDYKKAVKLSGGDPSIRTELARAYLMMDNEKMGMKELDNILKEHPNVSEARYLRSLVHYINGRVEPFIDDYLYYLQLSHDLDMRYINSVVDTAYEYILEYSDQILGHVMEPEDKAYWEYFEAYIKLANYRDTEGGLKHLDNALMLTNDSSELMGRIIALQMSYYIDNHEDVKALEAINKIEEILKRTNDEPAEWITASKADILVNLKQYQEALLSYSKAIEQNASTDSITTAYYYYLMSNVYNDKLGNGSKALNCIDSAISYVPDFTAYIYKHARICDKYFHDEAHANLIKADCEKILEIDTVLSVDSYRHFAYVLLGQKAEAEEWLGKIIAEYGNDEGTMSNINYNAACMYALMNDTYNATLLLMNALESGRYTCEQLNEDADFDNIRETPEFKSILKITCSNDN